MTLPTTAGVQSRIYTLPGLPPFMTVYDLAEFYEVKPDRIMQQMRRNIGRFPEGYTITLIEADIATLVMQNALPNRVNRGAVVVFTKKGALQLSSVLKGPVADSISVLIIDAFDAFETRAVQELRHLLARVQSDARGRRPIRSRIVDAVREGWTFEQLWRNGSISRPKLTEAIRDCLMLGLIETVPEGTVFVQELPLPENDPRQMTMGWDD